METLLDTQKTLLPAYNKNASIIDYIFPIPFDSLGKLALITKHEKLTYEKFIARCYSVAHQLKSMGIKKGDRIAICIRPSAEMLAIVLASLLIGACYIPIEANYPQQRIFYILNDSSPSLLIYDEKTAIFKNYQNLKLSIQKINFQSHKTTEIAITNIHGNDPAYIIYTSGSTGNPKGIILSHKAVNNHMIWMRDEFCFTQDDIFFLKTPITFDPSVWEMLLPFYLRASLIILDSDDDYTNIHVLIDYICKYQISVLQIVPTILHKLLRHPTHTQLNSLRYLFVGGESLSTCTKKMFFKKFTNQCQLINLYGPAEATIDATFHRVQKNSFEFKRNIIGKPIYNTQLYVLNEKMKPCNLNEVGELYISGDNLAIGYLNRPEENEKFFLQSPFNQNERIYKTGDLVKWNSHGQLEYCSRIDNQIKVNGVRIETDELRNFIVNINGVYDCVFDITFNQKHQYSILNCYIIPENEKPIFINYIKDKLKEKFPNFMLPHRYYIVNEPHLSCNGKIDIKKVKESIQQNYCKKKYFADITEKKLFKIWESILDTTIPDENTSFFELGGNSINTHLLLSEINTEFKLSIDINEIIDSPTISQQAKYINSKSPTNKKILFSLNAAAKKTIFLIHPIGGTLFWYLPLARLLENQIHVYGISDPGLINPSHTFLQIENMAEFYAELILSANPVQPICVGGASFGATVAVEIARLLIDRGYQISSVLIFDGWALYPTSLKDEQYFKSSMIRQQKEWVSKFKQLNYEKHDYEQLFEIQLNRLNMLFNYTMKPIDFHLTIFKAKELMPIFQSIDSPYNHWEKYSKNFDFHLVPGNHETMFLPPNVNTIALSLKNY